jgi:hypothetical protein
MLVILTIALLLCAVGIALSFWNFARERSLVSVAILVNQAILLGFVFVALLGSFNQ